MKLAGLLLSLFLLAAPAVALAQEDQQSPYEQKYFADPFYNEVVEAAKTKNARDLIEFLDIKIQDKPERIHPASLWLRSNTVAQRDIKKANALYFLSYSDIMLQLALAHKKANDSISYIAMTKTAVLLLYIFEMMASVDAMRCADPSVLPAVQSNMVAPRLAKISYAFEMLPKSDFEFFANEAITADKKFDLRKPNDYICGLGGAKLADMLRQQGVVTLEAKNPATGRTSMRVIPPQGYEYEPVYISDTEWMKRRPIVQDRIRSMWQLRFDTLSANKKD